MGFKALLKNAANKVEGIFGGKSSPVNLDLIQELDKSWSGRARAGPIHYSPLDASVRRRIAGLQPGDTSSHGRPRPSDGASKSSPLSNEHPQTGAMPRGSSVPCVIFAYNQLPAPTCLADGNAQRDSASSMEATKHGRPQASHPVEINGRSAAGRLGSQPAEMAATTTTAKNLPNGKLGKAKKAASKPRPVTQPPGGLTQALSRESSVHNGQTTSPNGDDATLSPASASWGKRVRQFKTRSRHNDSANSNASAFEPRSSDTKTCPQQAATGSTCIPSPDMRARDGETCSNPSADDAAGVIVVDPTLAVEWVAQTETDTAAAAAAVSGDVSAVLEDRAQDSVSRVEHVASHLTTESKSPEKPRRAASAPLAPNESLTSDGGASSSVPETSTASTHRSGAGCLDSGSRDWNARFVKRWKTVRQRARMQALGVRTIWKFDSPTTTGDHHPPELLTNELPRPESLTALSASVGGHVAVPRKRQEGHTAGAAVTRDPSLATLLLGEVVEIC